MCTKLGPVGRLAFSAVTTFVGCSSGVSNAPALYARMRIAGAQFVEGPVPVAEDGPAVASIDLQTNTVWPGYSNKLFKGALEPSATAATLALSGDEGYWIVTASVPDVSAPTLPTFRATVSFATTLAAGAYSLEVHAVDENGRLGPPRAQTLTALSAPPSRTVQGELVVTLTWDTQADIDLHVVDPLGNEIYYGAPSSKDAFVVGASVSSEASYGMLDLDSNADCRSDGLQQEDVSWETSPPSGHYLVRVDTASLCAQPNARWQVKVNLRGTTVAEAAGIALDSDTWGAHDRGAGLLAIGFDVP